MKGKSQVFSGELTIAYIIFMIVFITVVYMWTSVIRDIFESETLNELETTAADMSENLLKAPGFPENWSKSDVESVGLVNTSRSLNEDKIVDFIELMDSASFDDYCEPGISNYECNKHLTVVGAYDFYFTMEYLNGSLLYVQGVSCMTGKQPSDETQKVTMTRTALLNETIIRAKVTVWK